MSGGWIVVFWSQSGYLVMRNALACACPSCRKRLASKLRQDIPAMLVRADQLYASSGQTITCNLH
jgi:hypothetical protein